MIEIRFQYRPSQVNLNNPQMMLYTQGWTGNTTYQTPAIYQSLTSDGSLQSILGISGWTWDSGYMISESGSTEPLIQGLQEQDITGFGDSGFTYRVQFDIKGVDSYEEGLQGITPYIFGYSGQTVYFDGRYEQDITVYSGYTNNTLMFVPEAGFSGGVSNIQVTQTTSYDRQIDLYGEDTIPLTFQISTSVSDKGATYSKTIKLPGTHNNNSVFSNILSESVFFDLSGITNTGVVFLNKKIPAGIYQDSVQLISGFFELTSVIKKDYGKIEYEGTFYSNSKNLATTIGDKQIIGNDSELDDIDMSEYNHTFNFTNIVSSWNTSSTGYTGAKGYYYPVIDYSNITSGNEMRLENFRPSCYVKEVWDKIFTKAGFTYTSNFLNSSFFKKLIMPSSGKMSEWNLKFNNTRFKVGRYNNANGTEYPSGNQVPLMWEIVRYNQDTTGATTPSLFDPYNQWDTTNFKWVIQSSGAYELNAIIRYGIWMRNMPNPYPVNSPGNVIKAYMRLYRKRNGQEIVLKEVMNEHIIPTGSYSYTGGGAFIVNSATTYFSLLTEEEWFYTGDEIYFKVALDVNGFYTVGFKSFYFVKTNELDGSQQPYTQFFNTPIKKNWLFEKSMVYMNDSLPAMKQIEFIKSIANKFNLVFVENKDDSNNLIIEPYDNFYYSGYTTSEVVDWTYKVDTKLDKIIERIPYLLDKDINFKLTKDNNDVNLKTYSDAYSQEFGDKLVKNPYFADNIEKVEDKFSSTMLGYLGTTNWLVPKMYGKQDEYNGLPTDNDYNARFLYREVLTPVNTTGITFNQLLITGPVISGGTIGTGATIEVKGSTSSPAYAGFINNPIYPSIDLNYGRASYYKNPYNTSNNLSWLYWRKKIMMYMDINSRMLTCFIRLNPSDIALLDWRKRIFIDGNYYLLNKIYDWTPNKSVKVELLQIPNLADEIYFNQQSWMSSGVGGSGTGYGQGGSGSGMGSGVGSGSVGQGGGNTHTNVINLQPPSPVVYPDIMETLPESGWVVLTGVSLTDRTNYYPKGSTGIIMGESNNISGDVFVVQGSNNIVDGKNVSLLNSKNNNISTSEVVLIGSHNNSLVNNDVTTGSTTGTTTEVTSVLINSNNNSIQNSKIVLISSSDNIIDTGITNGFLVLTTGKTISEESKVFIKDKDWDTMADIPYVDTKSGETYLLATGDTVTYVDSNFYDKTTADSTFTTKGGGFSIKIKTTQGYQTNGEYLIADNYNGTGRTVTLATADKINGKVMIVHDLYGNANTNNIVITPQGLGTPLKTISVNNQLVIIYSDGSSWYSN